MGKAQTDAREKLPTLTQIGPYRIRGILGQGGMGVVYHGEELESGASVAVKTLDSKNQSPLASIRREIEALGRIEHPGIVKIVAHGVSEGVPWYAMELLRGQTLRHALASGFATRSDDASARVLHATETKDSAGALDARVPAVRRLPTRRADWAGTLAVVMRCCEALSYLHAMGIVHRDLKPENIFVREDGSPVLVDLGLAASFGGRLGREQLELTGDLLGTVGYMAPEQIRAGLVDARADLYALGCILYECIVGEPPFAGVASFAVLDAHIRKAPLPPSAVADDVPADLERLILRLLEKEPHDRVGYAEDVAIALEPHVKSVWSPGPNASSRRPYLYRPPFVGRELAVRELNDALGKIASGGRVYIAGESGVGKTRLVLETIGRPAWRHAAIVLSRCGSLGVAADAASSDRPLHAFAPVLLAVADHCSSGDVDHASWVASKWGRVLAPFQSALEGIPGYASLPEPQTLPPREARSRLLAALEEVLHAFAAVRPLVLVIDDLQWADELSLAYLQRAPERLAAVLIVGTYRADEATVSLREVVNAPGARHLRLRRFDREAVGAMVEGMLAVDEAPAPLVDFLQRRCAGNPFFILSYLHAAIGEGLLTRETGARWQLGDSKGSFDLEMPVELAELVALRLRRLGESALNLVRAGAVLGHHFDADSLFACAHRSEGDAAEDLQTLRERQILEEAGDGGLRFVHDKIRETAYERTPPTQSRELHLRAARSIEARRGPDLAWSLILAEHYARAGVPDQAATHFERAGELAAATYSNADAVHRYRAAIRELSLAALGESSRGTARLEEKIGDVLTVTGDHESARRSFEAALMVADPSGLAPARLLRKVGKTWEVRHSYEEALRCYGRGADLLGVGGLLRDDAWWQEVIQVTIERLWVEYWLNNVEGMERLIKQSIPLIREHGTPYQQARFMQIMATRNMRRERYLVSDETVGLARDALAAAANLNDEERAALRFVLFFTLYLRGHLDEAEAEGMAVLAWTNRAGASTLRVRTLTYLTAAARKQGRIDRVRDLVEETRALADAPPSAQRSLGPSVHYRGAMLANMCWLAWREDKRAESESYGRSALQSWEPERVPYAFQWLALFPLLAISAAAVDEHASIEYARALLAESQQRLEAPLTHEIESQLSNARERRGAFDANPILRAAERYRYL